MIHAALLDAGARFYRDQRPWLQDADPAGLVTPQAGLLCAALGLLGQTLYDGLCDSADDEQRPPRDEGRRRARREEVGQVAALLSLLTKVDDQVIDGPAFHGGPAARGRDRRLVRDRVWTYLSPTLESVRSGAPAAPDGRCRMAAALGRRLRALGDGGARYRHLLDVIAHGWGVQADAVSVLSSHPADVTLDEARRVTRDISGAWLQMIALCGTLPAEAAALPQADEELFYRFGGWIQAADALADLQKDLDEGLRASLPGCLLQRAAGPAFEVACARGDTAAIYQLCAAHGIDLQCVPTAAERAALLLPDAPALRETAALLGWIHHFLLWRYVRHERCCRRPEGTALADYAEAPTTTARAGAKGGLFVPEEAACSAR